MKYFLLIITAGIIHTLPALAQDVDGTWAWVGAGCRDSSLSADSHVTKSRSQNPFQISASRLNLNADGSASMFVDMAGDRQRETGTYEVRGSQVIISDPTFSTTSPAMVLDIVGDYLILSTASMESDDPQRDEYDPVIQACRNEGNADTYVYVFANVDD